MSIGCSPVISLRTGVAPIDFKLADSLLVRALALEKAREEAQDAAWDEAGPHRGPGDGGRTWRRIQFHVTQSAALWGRALLLAERTSFTNDRGAALRCFLYFVTQSFSALCCLTRGELASIRRCPRGTHALWLMSAPGSPLRSASFAWLSVADARRSGSCSSRPRESTCGASTLCLTTSSR